MTIKFTVKHYSEDRLFPLGVGELFCSVCAPKSWSSEHVAEQVNRHIPPGTSGNRWVISKPDDDRDDIFKGTNCAPCPDSEERQHWLLNCEGKGKA